MAPLPVIGNCVRLTLNWNQFANVAPRNVFHILTDSSDESQIGEDVEASFTGTSENPFYTMSSSYTLGSIDILLLNGTSPTYNHSVGTSISGGVPGAGVPNAAAVLSLHTNQRGPQGRGRMYIGPIAEGAIADGMIELASTQEHLDGWNQFIADLLTTDTAGSLCVASYTHSVAYGVNTLSMRQPAGTMRRRQNQLV